MKPQTNIVKLFDQGGHGCIFYPGPSCSGGVEDKKYITKIHINDEHQENEIMISNKIKQIKRFSQYFSPIISNCKIDLAEVHNNEINKCDFIREHPADNNKYMSTKTIYVEGTTYADYLIELSKMSLPLSAMNPSNKFLQPLGDPSNKFLQPLGDPSNKFLQPLVDHPAMHHPEKHRPNKFLASNKFLALASNKFLANDFSIIIVEIYKKLIAATNKLLTQGICHYDLKTSNIIIKKQTNQPIIIDFGITMVPEEIQTDKQYKSAFYVYSTEYTPWSIDIVIISYLVQKYNLTINQSITVEDIEEIKKIINEKTEEIERISGISTAEYKQNKIAEIQKYANPPLVHPSNKFLEPLVHHPKMIVEELKKKYAGWDKYAIAIMTISIVQTYKLIIPEKILARLKSQIFI